MSLKNLLVGHQVRKAGAPFDTKNVGTIVERHPYPHPVTTEGLSSEEFATELNLANAMPAQLKVYWPSSGLITLELETDIDGAYPGGNAYRAWDHEFPLFSVESGGYGDITVITPDGEKAVCVYGGDLAEYESLNDDPDAQWRFLVLHAVNQYLDKVVEVPEPAEPDTQEQFENAEFENAS